MDRRRALAAGAGTVLTGAGLWAALGGGGGSVGGGGDDGAGGLPVTVEVVEPAGGADTIRLPRSDAVTVVDLFATWCPTCPEQLEEVAAVNESHRDDDVAFVSVTNERFGAEFTRDDLLAWWDDHGGPWTLAHDPESAAMAAIQAPGLPYLAVVEPSGRVVYGESGTADAAAIDDAIASATR